jgi:hypothetical protein
VTLAHRSSSSTLCHARLLQVQVARPDSAVVPGLQVLRLLRPLPAGAQSFKYCGFSGRSRPARGPLSSQPDSESHGPARLLLRPLPVMLPFFLTFDGERKKGAQPVTAVGTSSREKELDAQDDVGSSVPKSKMTRTEANLPFGLSGPGDRFHVRDVGGILPASTCFLIANSAQTESSRRDLHMSYSLVDLCVPIWEDRDVDFP